MLSINTSSAVIVGSTIWAVIWSTPNRNYVSVHTTEEGAIGHVVATMRLNTDELPTTGHRAWVSRFLNKGEVARAMEYWQTVMEGEWIEIEALALKA